jgi:hypothetical protein
VVALAAEVFDGADVAIFDVSGAVAHRSDRRADRLSRCR